MNQRGEEATQLVGEERALLNGGHDLEPREETADQVALRHTLVGRRGNETTTTLLKDTPVFNAMSQLQRNDTPALRTLCCVLFTVEPLIKDTPA